MLLIYSTVLQTYNFSSPENCFQSVLIYRETSTRYTFRASYTFRAHGISRNQKWVGKKIIGFVFLRQFYEIYFLFTLLQIIVYENYRK
jgi:hypothetical protein